MEEDRSHLQFWLSTAFQNIIQVSLQLSNNPAPEQTPYIYKYDAIAKFKTLLQRDHPYHFIVHLVLGQIYSDVDQLSDSIRSYQNSLIGLSQLDQKQVGKFYNHMITLYNMLGLSYVNRQHEKEGVGCLAKAMEIYTYAKNLNAQNVYNNRSDQPKGRKFRCYYQGGINKEELQNGHTLTLFYLAQAYTKLGFKDKAAQYCGYTLQRQFLTKKFEFNEFCHNLIGLAEYYEGNHYYSQALYLLMLALEVLPQEQEKQIRARVQIALGALQLRMLQYSVDKIKALGPNQNLDKQNEIANKPMLLFQGFKQQFPKVQLANNLQECKGLFRKANTQYKKAMQFFVLDGYVTDYIDIQFAISKLYFQLCKLELSREKVCAMLERRKEHLEPLLNQLNPKAYPATWQKVLVEVSQIYNDQFQIKNLMAIDVKQGRQINGEKLRKCVETGNKLIHYYGLIIAELQNDKQAEKNVQYYRSLINSKFNIAKTLSKMYSVDVKERVEFLKRSWEQYKSVAQFIKTKAHPQDEFEKQLQLTNDMISMLPNKIDRINYGQVSPFE